MTKRSKRVLVTGGSGFIGSNLGRELERRGREVWVCDLMHSCKPNYVRCDVGKFRQVERLFEEHDFDSVCRREYIGKTVLQAHNNAKKAKIIAEKVLHKLNISL